MPTDLITDDGTGVHGGDDAQIARLESRVEFAEEANVALVKQVTSDFEELVFLRSMGDHLAVATSQSNLEPIVSGILPMLNRSVDAEWLCFVSASQVSKAPKEILSWIGELKIDPAIIGKIVNDHIDRMSSGPVVRNDIRRTEQTARYDNVNAFVAAQVGFDGDCIGWIVGLNSVGHRSSEFDEFGSHQATLIATTGNIIAAQAKNIQMLREKEALLVGVVRSFVHAVEAKDQYTCGHSERVALYARELALTLGYSEEEAERLYLAGLLHDVGKIGVSDSVLRKSGPLTDEEFEEIKRHPDEGWAILSGLKPLGYVLAGVLHHHERVDGKGYPDKLLGEQISLDARILAVADSYDAMTSDRPYRQGMSLDKALDILRDGAGTQWDSQVIDAFFRTLPTIDRIRQTFRAQTRPQRTADEKLAEDCRSVTQ